MNANREVEAFRREYRATQIGAGYRGWVHFGFTAGLGLAVVVFCAARLEAVTPLEWLTVPLTFLYANLVEYLGHRGPMHHPVRGLRRIFARHTLEHHRFFTHERMRFDEIRDFKAVLFPPVLIVFFVAGFAVPAGLLLSWLATPNVALLAVATAVGYFLNYELLHFAYHCDPGSRVGRLPGLARLRRLHSSHHDPALMARYNFNITYPICDWVFGTLRRSPVSGATPRS